MNAKEPMDGVPLKRISSALNLIPWLVLASGMAPVHAAPINYDINFTSSAGPNATGSFTYDAAVPAFTNFIVNWNGLTFDLTASANNPGDVGASTTPSCLSGLAGAAAGFAWLSPGCQTSGQSGGWGGFDYFSSGAASNVAGFYFVESDSETLEISFSETNAPTSLNPGLGGDGTFTLSVIPTGTPSATPEPASIGLMLAGVGLMAAARKRRPTSIR